MDDGSFKPCPFCKEKIRASAVKCRFCGEWLEQLPEAPPTSPPLTKPQEVKKSSHPNTEDGKETNPDTQQQVHDQPATPMSAEAAKKQLKTATLLYLLPLTYFLIISANAAWTALAKDHGQFSSGVIITTCVVNTLIGFVERALLSPLGILCLVVYAYFAWNIRKMLKQFAKSPTDDTSAEPIKIGSETNDSLPDPSPEIVSSSANTDSPQAKSAVEVNQQVPNIEKVQRPGIKAAAIFLIVNAVLTFLLTVFLQGGAASAVTTSTLYRSMFFGDIICALALFSGREGWRWYVIARTIYGALYWVVLTPVNQGTAMGWLTGFAQLLFLGGLLALVLIKSPAKLRVRWAIASVVIALVSVSTLNAIRFVQFQQTKKTLLATMPWISPELMNVFLKEMISRNLNEAQFQEFFSTTLDKGQQQLTSAEREEISQIYGVAYASLPHDEATLFSSFGQKIRSRQPLTEVETDQMVQLTTKALSSLKEPYKTRFQLLMTKAFKAGKRQP